MGGGKLGLREEAEAGGGGGRTPVRHGRPAAHEGWGEVRFTRGGRGGAACLPDGVMLG